MNPLAAAFALVSVTLLWAGTIRVPALRGTTLTTAHRGLLAGLAIWSVAVVLSVLPRMPSPGWHEQIWYAAAVAMLCPPVAVLGARRPGASAWVAFVLAPLVIVMEWPALAQWRAGHPPDRLALELPTVLGFVLVVTMGCGNYFGTRFTTAGMLYAASLLGIVIPGHLRSEPVEPAARSLFQSEGFWSTLGLLAALASARRADRIHRATTSALPGWDRVWLDFRDAFGIVWAKRLMDRINEAANDERWPFRLGLAGFEPAPDARSAIDAGRAEERRDHWMRFVLKRFVDTPWIEARLGK